MKKQICDFLLWIRTLRRFSIAINLKFKISALFLLGLFLACFVAIPVNAADKILFSYGPEIFSLKVSSLACIIHEHLFKSCESLTPKGHSHFTPITVCDLMAASPK